MKSDLRVRLAWAAIVMMAWTAGSGCALLTSDNLVQTVGKSPLKQVTPTIDAIELEVFFIERPVGDPLIGSSLWSDLDTLSSLHPASATSLRRNGFRFGVSGSEPPRALAAAVDVAGGRFNGHRSSQRSGEEMAIDASRTYPSCQIQVDESGQRRQYSYEQAKCVFRVTPERLQDGWVRLEFLPEIHHGEMKIRQVPGNQDWQHLPSQLIDPLFDQRFSVELNLGEMIVLSADGDDAESVGHHFFRGGTSADKLQRVLIIRLAGMKRL
ncbi:MAG: hypothetical protein AB7U20_11160, partial [Planctomycetaceae bacterium]